jgi:hypothetical protein
MTETAVATRPTQPELTSFEVIEKVITSGDLSRMQPAERVAFYWRTCESLGLNPLTRPFEYLSLNGKLILYARKDATEQLRRLNGVSVSGLEHQRTDDLEIVTAHGIAANGREDSAIGAVSIKGLSGEALANAIMKAETKAKRRLTLSLVGLGFLDESEAEGGERVDVDPDTGAIRQTEKPRTLLEAVHRQAANLVGDVVDGQASEVVDSAARPEATETAAVGAAAADVQPDVQTPATTQRSQPRAAATGLCAVASPYGDDATCGMAPGHLDVKGAVKVHKAIGPDGQVASTWPAE